MVHAAAVAEDVERKMRRRAACRGTLGWTTAEGGWVALTHISPAWLNDDGPPAPGLLLHLGHALPCLLVRVIGGTHSDLVLDAA